MFFVLVVMMIGRWSDPRVLTTLQDVVGARLGEQKVMSGEEEGLVGIWVC